MTLDELFKVSNMHSLSYSPREILNAFRVVNPNLHLVPQDVYNLLYKMQLEELARQTPIKRLLKVRFYFFRNLILSLKSFIIY